MNRSTHKNIIYNGILTLCFLFAATFAHAAIQEHTFTITGTDGETGTGSFTWDDAIVPDGNVLPLGNLLSLTITLTGGNVIAPPTTFDLADCTDADLADTPNFAFDISFECTNGTNSLSFNDAFIGNLGGGISALTYVSGSPPSAAPTLSQWMLILLALMLGGIGYTMAMKTKES